MSRSYTWLVFLREQSVIRGELSLYSINPRLFQPSIINCICLIHYTGNRVHLYTFIHIIHSHDIDIACDLDPAGGREEGSGGRAPEVGRGPEQG